MTTEQQRRLFDRRRRFLIRALESGGYPETGLALRDDDGYCPLGVGCDVYKRATGRGMWVIHPSFPNIDNGMRAFTVDGETEDAVMPVEVQRWFGFKYKNGAWDVPEEARNFAGAQAYGGSLTDENDNHDGFAGVIRILQKPPVGLFTWEA